MRAPVLAQGIPGTRAYVEAQKGWEAIRDGRHQDAAEAFALALDAEPRDPSNHFGSGLAAYLLGQPTVAQHELERALELAPALTDASLLLAEVLYRASDIAGALRVYEAALEFAPADDTLRTRLDDLRQEAAVHGNFLESHGAHFTVLFEGASDAEMASRVIDILEAAYWRVSTALAIYPERRITVVLYTRRSSSETSPNRPSGRRRPTTDAFASRSAVPTPILAILSVSLSTNSPTRWFRP